jgi:hypothetical protein
MLSVDVLPLESADTLLDALVVVELVPRLDDKIDREICAVDIVATLVRVAKDNVVVCTTG